MATATRVLNPAEKPQLIYLGALTATHRNTTFAIRARVTYLFRSETGSLLHLRLHAYPPTTSQTASPSSITLYLTGRWQTACAFLQQNNLIQVDGPSLRPGDCENSLSLHLEDPIPDASRAHFTNLYYLDDSSVPTRVVLYRKIHLGMVVPSADLVASFTKPIPCAPDTTVQRDRTAVAVSGTSSREYSYMKIADLWDNAPGKDVKVNVYGVILDCRAPCTTRGPDLRSEIIIADESSVNPGPLRTMVIYRFEKNPSNSIPFRSVGDVIRIHRVHVDRFRDTTSGIDQVQGVARYYSTFLMWEHESDNYLPLSSRDPVRASKRDPSPPNNVTHTITAHDRERVAALRAWGNEYLFKSHRVQRPYLRNLLEVTNALPNADFLSLSFDLVCCLEGEYDDESGIGNLRFVVSDGLLSREQGGKRMLVESDISFDHQEKAPQHPFVDFSPSWPMRPTSLPAWVLIRDVRVALRENCRVLILSVGRKTSTVIWHPKNSPDVRHMKELFAKTTGMRKGATPTRIVNPSAQTGPASAARSPPKRPYSPPKVTSHVSDGQPVRKVAATDAAATNVADSPERFEESKAKSIEQAFDTQRYVITVHSNQDKKTSTIADMLTAVRAGRLEPRRLLANARSCMSPQEVRFACRPCCAVCDRFLTMDGADAFRCAACAGNLKDVAEPGVKWVYAVLLNLEDGSGGRVEGWVDGKEGADFFGIAPTNLMKDREARQAVSNCLKNVLSPQSRIDCSVKPYEYEDEYGLYRVACKIFATRLLPEYVSGEKGL